MVGLTDDEWNAPVLGSLIDPEIGLSKDALIEMKWEEVGLLLTKALSKEQDTEKTEIGVVAQGIAKAAPLLAEKYHWVITNVPYLAWGKQSEILREYCENHHKEAKNDLATVFLDRCLELCVEDGTSSIVLPQNWLFLTSYKKFREKLLKNHTWHQIARLGPHAFETISGEVVKAILITLSRGTTRNGHSDTTLNHGAIRGLDVSEPRTAAGKAAQLLTSKIKSVEQVKQLENPDAVVTLEGVSQSSLLGEFATCIEGLSTGDGEQFICKFWELNDNGTVWEPFIQNVNESVHYGGRMDMVRWGEGNGVLHSFPSAHNFPSPKMNGFNVLGGAGFRITQMQEPKSTIYTGEIFGKSGGSLVLIDGNLMPSIWCYTISKEFGIQVNKVNQSLYKPVGTFLKVPFDLDHWTKVAEKNYPHGLPNPYSDDPTQWIFHGHPCGSVVWDEENKWTAHGPLRIDATVLQVTVARLLGYRWPAELDPDMELSDEQREWVKRCETLLPLADGDGIVCIPPVRGEMKAEDRMETILAAAYGSEWSSSKKSELLAQADHVGKTLETWLREKFFTQHCKLFHHRPFIWHIWDGLQDGFAALVNYHKLDYKLLETLIYTYLGDWISRQKQDIDNGVDGAEEKLAAAETLKKHLEMILKGEKPYDIFVRWKPIEKQPIGWNPDLNDGVRLNIRPFMSVPDLKKKGAGVLFDKPNVKWGKDRGKDVVSAPWYSLGPHYGGKDGDRINDHHLSLAEKRAAREAAE